MAKEKIYTVLGKYILDTNIHDHILQRINVLMANLSSYFHECYIKIGTLTPDEICKRQNQNINQTIA